MTDVEEIKICIVREKCLAYRTEKDAMKQPKVAHMPLNRSTELGREVYAATNVVAHMPLDRSTEIQRRSVCSNRMQRMPLDRTHFG